MLLTRPSRLSCPRATFALLAMLAVSACASVDKGMPPDANSAGPDAPNDPIAGLLRDLPDNGRQTALGPTADRFIGKPVAVLERLTGAPSLSRREGNNEFRRYDLGHCRAYAVVIPAGGTVTSLTTGPSVVGTEAQPFEKCTAGLRVGS